MTCLRFNYNNTDMLFFDFIISVVFSVISVNRETIMIKWITIIFFLHLR